MCFLVWPTQSSATSLTVCKAIPLSYDSNEAIVMQSIWRETALGAKPRGHVAVGTPSARLLPCLWSHANLSMDATLSVSLVTDAHWLALDEKQTVVCCHHFLKAACSTVEPWFAVAVDPLNQVYHGTTMAKTVHPLPMEEGHH